MNSTKLFNLKYLVQNLKKSRGILLLSLLAMPIFTFIMMIGYTEESYHIVSDLENLSPVALVFAFIIPIILAITLFNYVFKKKSVDFINSMPITKKSIFLTNMLGGTVLIFVELLISLLIIVLFSLIAQNIVVTPALCFDYMLVWFITYMFMFVASSFAIAISGNIVTSLVVLALVICFIPFLGDYIKNYNYSSNLYNIKCEEEACKPNYYYCYSGDKECKINKSLGIYEIDLYERKTSNHAMPYNVFAGTFFGYDFAIYNTISLIKTLVLTAVLFVLGLFLFVNRKMEVCETSFKNINIHLFVKCLTLLPMILLLYEVIDESAMTFLIAFALIVVYYFAYDLITKRSITYIKKSIIYFIVSTMIYLGISGFVDSQFFRELTDKNNKIYSNEIIEIKLTDYVKNNLFDEYTDNREIINFVLSRTIDNEAIYSYEDNYISYSYYNVLLKMKDGRVYETQVPINVEEYEKLLNLIKEDNDITEKVKDFKFKNLIALKFNDNSISIDREIIELLEQRISSLNNEEYYKSYLKDYNGFDVIYLYCYENHELKTYYLNLELDAEIEDYLAEYNNKKLKDILEYEFDNDKFIINIDYLDSDSYNYDDNSWYFVNELSKELYEFAKKYHDKDFDATKKCAIIRFYYDGMTRYLYTNEVEELEKIYLDKKEEIIVTKEYQDYIKEMGEKLYD